MLAILLVAGAVTAAASAPWRWGLPSRSAAIEAGRLFVLQMSCATCHMVDARPMAGGREPGLPPSLLRIALQPPSDIEGALLRPGCGLRGIAISPEEEMAVRIWLEGLVRRRGDASGGVGN